jgi:hypothetical protein
MKTLSKILLCLACTMLMANCEKENIKPTGNELDPNNVFAADFTVWKFSEPGLSPEISIESSNCSLTWKGEGNSYVIGSFGVEITLNCNLTTGEFCDLNGTIITEDGSELFFLIREGKICPFTGEGCNYYQSFFNDPAEITGGTGQFLYVTGSFYPNAFIHEKKHGNDTWFAKFACEGKITNFYRSDEDHINRNRY